MLQRARKCIERNYWVFSWPVILFPLSLSRDGSPVLITIYLRVCPCLCVSNWSSSSSQKKTISTTFLYRNPVTLSFEEVTNNGEIYSLQRVGRIHLLTSLPFLHHIFLLQEDPFHSWENGKDRFPGNKKTKFHVPTQSVVFCIKVSYKKERKVRRQQYVTKFNCVQQIVGAQLHTQWTSGVRQVPFFRCLLPTFRRKGERGRKEMELSLKLITLETVRIIR